MKTKQQFFGDLVSGGFAGIISKTIVAPIERVKLLMQTQTENSKIKKNYNGIIDCFNRCIKEDGFWSLWRGNGVNVVRYFPTQALSFAFKDYFNSFFRIQHETKRERMYYLFVRIMNGGLAGSFTTLFVHPLDFARTRIGVDLGKSISERQFKGLRHCLQTTYNKQGLRGVYRGISIAIPSMFLYRGLYFGIYDTGKAILFDDTSSLIGKFFWAQCSVIFSEFLAYPGDTIKRKLMMQSMRSEKLYSGMVDCCIKIYKWQGLSGLWKGAYSNILRSVGSSLCLIMYDQFQKLSKNNQY